MVQLDLMERAELPVGVQEIQPSDTKVLVGRDALGEILGVYEYRGIIFRKVRYNDLIRVHVPTWSNVKKYGLGKYTFGRSCVSITPGNKNRPDDPMVHARNYIDKDYPEGWKGKIHA